MAEIGLKRDSPIFVDTKIGTGPDFDVVDDRYPATSAAVANRFGRIFRRMKGLLTGKDTIDRRFRLYLR